MAIQSNLQAGVEKTFQGVIKEINNASKEIDPKLERLRANIGKIFALEPNDIIGNENIRTNFDKESEDFKRLLQSVKSDGVLQSLVVELRENGDKFQLICVAGHRRLEAAKEAGISKVPCLIQKFTDPSNRTRVALAENIIRENLHPLDVAEGYSELLKMGWDEEKIAQYFERDEKTIRRYLNIAGWREDIKELVFKHKEIFNYSVIMKKYALRTIMYNEQQDELKTEFLKLIENKDKIEVKKNPSNDIIINELREKISLKVEIKEKDDKGKLSIAFNNAEEKAKILNIFGVTT